MHSSEVSQVSTELKQEVQQFVNKLITDYLTNVRHCSSSRLNNAWFIPVTFRTDMRVVAGYAYLGSNLRIELNEVLFLENKESFFQDTIKHEVAHVLAAITCPNRKQEHGPEWRAIMTSLGGVPKRTHSYDVSSVVKGTRVKYNCQCTDTEGNLKVWNLSKIIHGKISKGQSMLCPFCMKRVIKVE
jgi:predicted SprT family Zn-dependent metalloprotease